ncbi:MAG TPA: ribosome small subunit-dependent GTPase A [Candidatus Baltobacteraceae bacterium]|jgi:ribosome biogenesis GTPase|nr:ribosome small subunit-dependent GTPase A [Candidatus Baltobacteraceae bacterium]
MSDLHRAFVVSTGKNSAWISIDGEPSPRLAQLRRMSGKRFMPVPGDVVAARVLEDGHAVIERIEPRTLSLQRHSAGGRSKTMAANVDLLVTVTSLANPAPRPITLDQLLAFAELEKIAAAVVLTKPDLADSAGCEDLAGIYRALEYPTIVVNPKRGEIEPLRDLIGGRHAMLAGNSGVGKSTIFRALGGDTSVGEVSRHGLGRQTTSAGRLYRLAGGFLIDSPGISEFGLGQVDARTLAPAFREIPPLAALCRFADCTHLAEPDCAVAAAAADGAMAPSRYASYRRMILEPA